MAGAPSSWRPPWFDTTTAAAPWSTARAASSARQTPLSITGTPASAHSQSTSRHDSDASIIQPNA